MMARFEDAMGLCFAGPALHAPVPNGGRCILRPVVARGKKAKLSPSAKRMIAKLTKRFDYVKSRLPANHDVTVPTAVSSRRSTAINQIEGVSYDLTWRSDFGSNEAT
jgi:hypothetical protein